MSQLCDVCRKPTAPPADQYLIRLIYTYTKGQEKVDNEKVWKERKETVTKWWDIVYTYVKTICWYLCIVIFMTCFIVGAWYIISYIGSPPKMCPEGKKLMWDGRRLTCVKEWITETAGPKIK